ncbi:MAG: hypothetical protein Q9P90_03905 [candidate division KSB1 bacterium]|nr:hypothetical protein [candidate division KSB1 bacterium]
MSFPKTNTLMLRTQAFAVANKGLFAGQIRYRFDRGRHAGEIALPPLENLRGIPFYSADAYFLTLNIYSRRRFFRFKIAALTGIFRSGSDWQWFPVVPTLQIQFGSESVYAAIYLLDDELVAVDFAGVGFLHKKFHLQLGFTRGWLPKLAGDDSNKPAFMARLDYPAGKRGRVALQYHEQFWYFGQDTRAALGIEYQITL